MKFDAFAWQLNRESLGLMPIEEITRSAQLRQDQQIHLQLTRAKRSRKHWNAPARTQAWSGKDLRPRARDWDLNRGRPSPVAQLVHAIWQCWQLASRLYRHAKRRAIVVCTSLGRCRTCCVDVNNPLHHVGAAGGPQLGTGVTAIVQHCLNVRATRCTWRETKGPFILKLPDLLPGVAASRQYE